MLPNCCQNGAKVANTIGSLVDNSSATAFGGLYLHYDCKILSNCVRKIIVHVP